MTRLAVQVKLSLVVAACLLGLVISLKNVVGVSSEVLARDFIIYAITYACFVLFAPVREGAKAWGLYSLHFSGLVIVLTTVAVGAFYALAP